MNKKIIYVDLDGVIVNFPERIEDVDSSIRDDCINWCKLHNKHHSDFEGIFRTLKPIDGAIEAIQKLSLNYEIYFLSSAPWNNISSWSQKRKWVEDYLPNFPKKLILSHRKDLNRGAFLIDDRPRNGAIDFNKYEGQKWIHFGSKKFANWKLVLDYLKC